MLKADPALPFVDVARSGRKMLDFLNRAVLPLAWPGHSVTKVEQREMAYTPGRKCTALYSLELADQSPAEPVWASVSFAKDGRLEELYRQFYEKSQSKNGLPAVVNLPDYRCLVEFFPMDGRLPALFRAVDPRKAAGRLVSALDGGSAKSRTGVEVAILKYRPHETCVLNYTVRPPGEYQRDVTGKVYRESSRAQRVWESLKSLDGNSGVMIPRPLGFVNEWNLVLMERAPGISMKILLEEAGTEAQARELSKLAATTLAAFHGMQLDAHDTRTVETELARVQKRTSRLRYVAPELERAVQSILDEVSPLLMGSCAYPLTLIHGDCKPSQFLVNGDRVAMVDFDATCRGDRSFDVGNLMAQFDKIALTSGNEHLAELSNYFLANYLSRSPFSTLQRRSRLCHVVSLLRLAVRSFEDFPHHRDERTPSLTDLLIQEAEHCLSKLS